MFRITLILNNLLFEETGSSIYRKIPLPTDGRYSVTSVNVKLALFRVYCMCVYFVNL